MLCAVCYDCVLIVVCVLFVADLFVVCCLLLVG